MKLLGPFEIEMKIHVTNGSDIAIVTYSLPSGKIPTRKTIQKGIDQALSAISKQAKGNWRPLAKKEFINSIIQDRTGTDDWAEPEGQSDEDQI